VIEADPGAAQREAWQQRVLPPVEKVVSGVWSVPVPIPDNPLRYVLCYLIEHRGGMVMVDPGWNHPDSWQALVSGLQTCEIPLSAVTAVIITHVHPDHHGLSGRVREASGAWIGMHEREDAQLARMNSFASGGDGRQREWVQYQQWCGAPEQHIRDMAAARQMRPRIMVRADRVIEHGQLIDVPGLALRAVWTPGHSPGHLCLYDEDRDLLLTGDHVLPRITPNVSAYDASSRPLGDYLASIEALRGMQPGEVLPAHEYRFTDLDTRLGALAGHHAGRLSEIEQVLADAPGGLSTWQVAERVTWSRGWDQLSGFPRQAALGEVSAHLRHLEASGTVRCADADGIGLWRRADSAPVPSASPLGRVSKLPTQQWRRP
jgi:glyoxylase-like metal-dependent hydrolase (beta-lactamase superfamily II)